MPATIHDDCPTPCLSYLCFCQVRRLPVVSDDGKLVGMFTRGDVIKAALAARKAAKRTL